MQITAELDKQHVEKLHALEKLLNKDISELLALAIDKIYDASSTLSNGFEKFQDRFEFLLISISSDR